MPVLHIQGELDDMEKAMSSYERLQNIPKMYAMVYGANHYGITNVNNPDGAHEDATLPQVDQDDEIQYVLFTKINDPVFNSDFRLL